MSERKFSTGLLSIDQSTALINEETYGYFENYAEKNDFMQKFRDLKSGVRLNNTENRAVTHFKYRDPESDLYSKSLNDGVAEYEVEFEGKAMDLAMGLSQTTPDGLNFKVTGMTGNRITAEIVQ